MPYDDPLCLSSISNEHQTMRKRANLFRSSSDSDDSDPEESIEAVHPDEEQPMFLFRKKNGDERPLGFSNLVHRLLDPLKQGKVWWVQCVTIFIAASFTYSYNNVGENKANVQIAIMTVITLVGASPFCSTHLASAAIGAFVGGQNIIGSTGLLESNTEVRPTNYLWLLLLSLVVGCCFVLISRLRILDGYAGRLGTTTFVGMNLVMIMVYGPAGVVDWDRYYYGLTRVIHLAEEDSKLPLASAWTWTEEAELAIGYCLAVLWLGLIGGATRIRHHEYIQQWHRKNKMEQESRQPPKPLNNVLIPVIWALLSMLVVNATQYKHANGLYNGFAVGSYVAMASLQNIPSVAKFASVSLLAAVWGLALTPFFVSFAGKSGFTSMLGHVTHVCLDAVQERLKIYQRNQQEREERRQQEREQQGQRQQSVEEPPLQNNPESESPPSSPRPQPSGRKYIKRKETLYTKQQRRQQQRLKHHQGQQQQQQTTQTPPLEHEQASPKLHHRAWSALPTTSDGIWQHPFGEPTSV
jgi:hypothetical protein